MKVLALTFMLALASGNPQYNYQRPSGGSHSPGGNGRPSNGKGPSYSSQNGGGYNNNRLSGGFGGGGGGGFGGNGGFGGTGGFGGNGQFPGATGAAFGGAAAGGVGGFSTGFAEGGQSGGSFGQQPTIIQKNVYVHIPPPELEEAPEVQVPLSVGAPEKNYKIIFIKAPAPKQASVPLIPPQPKKEEKTLVYVLVKKPEDAPQVAIPTPEPTEPSKPEVFFIRYKNIREQGAGEGGYPQAGEGPAASGSGYPSGQNNGQGYPTGGNGVSVFPSQQPIGNGYPTQQSGGKGYLPPDQRRPTAGGY